MAKVVKHGRTCTIISSGSFASTWYDQKEPTFPHLPSSTTVFLQTDQEDVEQENGWITVHKLPEMYSPGYYAFNPGQKGFQTFKRRYCCTRLATIFGTVRGVKTLVLFVYDELPWNHFHLTSGHFSTIPCAQSHHLGLVFPIGTKVKSTPKTPSVRHEASSKVLLEKVYAKAATNCWATTATTTMLIAPVGARVAIALFPEAAPAVTVTGRKVTFPLDRAWFAVHVVVLEASSPVSPAFCKLAGPV